MHMNNQTFGKKVNQPHRAATYGAAMEGLFTSWTCVNKCTVEISTEKINGAPASRGIINFIR